MLLALALSGCGRKVPPPAPPPEVLVTEVREEDVPIYDDFVGTLDGSVNASIQARVQGYLISQNYKEGGEVKKGDLLFQIDPRSFEAALAQAKAALAQAEAAARQADMVAERTLDLFARKTLSEQERDNAVQQAEAARANVEAQRAAVAQAQLNVDHTAIRSPVDGIAGLARAQVGDLVGPGTGVLTTVSTVNPIKALFTVSDQRYVAYTHRWAGNPDARAEHERQLEYELILADGSRFPHKGRLFAVDTEVDVRTGSQQIVALFPNPGNILRRGQFARVRLRSEIRRGALLVPQRAVTEIQGTHQVVVVGPENKAEIRPVKTGRRIQQMWIIEEGLKPGEHIVVEGVQKARAGVTVNPKPWAPPSPSPGAPNR
jgi:membrane fusion protein (multidrug efflux system)